MENTPLEELKRRAQAADGKECLITGTDLLALITVYEENCETLQQLLDEHGSRFGLDMAQIYAQSVSVEAKLNAMEDLLCKLVALNAYLIMHQVAVQRGQMSLFIG